MAFGDGFAQSYLAAQQQAQQAAVEAWQQQHQQAMMDLESRLRDQALAWQKDPNNPDNVLKQAHSDYYTGMEATRAADEADKAKDRSVQRFNTAMGPKGPGMTFGQALPILPSDMQQQVTQQGVAAGNQANMQQAVQQSPASWMQPDPGSATAGGPLIGPPPAGSYLPPDQAGPTLPPLTPDVQPGMAGPRMMEPAGVSAVPYGAQDFLNSQSPAFLQEQARQQNMMQNRDAGIAVRQGNLKVAEARQQLAERIGKVREANLKLMGEKLQIQVDRLPDDLDAKQEHMQRLNDHLDFMEDLATSKLGMAKDAAALAQKRFVAANGQKAYANLVGARKSAVDAEEAVLKDNRALSMLKGQRDKLMGEAKQYEAALGKADPTTAAAIQTKIATLNSQAQDIQDQASSVAQQLAIHQKAQNVADQMRQQIENDLVTSGVLKGAATKTTEKPVTAKTPAPPKMDLNALKLKYGVR